MAKATKLTKLRVEELSGVDEPANGTPGWMLRKSKDWKADLEDFEKSVIATYESLGSDALGVYLSDAPEEVVAARDLLKSHIAKGIDGAESEEDDEEDGDDEEPTRKSALERFREVFKSNEESDEDDESGDEDESDEDESDEDEDSSDEDGDDEDDESGDEDESDEDESDEDEDSSDEDGDDEDDESGDEPSEVDDDVVKALATAISEQLDPIKEAVVKVADRVEGLEKGTATRTGLDGQESAFDESEEDEESEGMAKAVRVALARGKVTLN